MRSYRPEELFDADGTLVPGSPDCRRGRAADGRQPVANGGELLVDLRLPDFRATRSTCRARRHVLRGDARAWRVAARRGAGQPRDIPDLRPRETASNRLGPVLDVTERQFMGDPPHGRPGAGGARRRGAQRAPLPGLARGLSAHRPPRPVQLLRGLHPHHRLDVQPARQVAEGHATSRGGGRSSSLNYLLTSHVWRQDHNGFLTRTRLHRPRGQQEGEIIRVYLPPTPTACCPSATTACAAATTST